MVPLLSGYPDLPRIVIYPSYSLRIETSIPSSTFFMSMKDYADSLGDIKEIRKVEDRKEPLTKLEMKEYRKMTGKIACPAC